MTPSVARIRHRGFRVSGGPWNAYIAPAAQPGGRLVAALGRSAGTAVTRSRARRIARDVFRPLCHHDIGMDVLLFAREDLGAQSRRHLRTTLQELLGRGAKSLERRGEFGKVT